MNWICCYLSQVKRMNRWCLTPRIQGGAAMLPLAVAWIIPDRFLHIATFILHLCTYQIYEWKLKLSLCLLQYWQPMTVMTANALHTIEAPLLVGCCEVFVLLKPNHHLLVRLTGLSKELAETSLVLWLDEWAFTSWPRILCLVEMPMWMCLYTKMFEASALHNLPGMLLTLAFPRTAKIQSTFRSLKFTEEKANAESSQCPKRWKLSCHCHPRVTFVSLKCIPMFQLYGHLCSARVAIIALLVPACSHWKQGAGYADSQVLSRPPAPPLVDLQTANIHIISK